MKQESSLNFTLKTVIVVCTLLLFGCNNSYTEKGINEGMSDAKTEMAATRLEGRDMFRSNYENAMSNANDSISIKLKTFFSTVNGTLDYIDSLKMEIEKLSDRDEKSIALIKQTFLEYKAGDRLFSKLQDSYTLAQDVALTEQNKLDIAATAIDVLTPVDRQKWTEQYFASNVPTGVVFLLSGFETQLLNAAISSLNMN